jgi:hypothetical protein
LQVIPGLERPDGGPAMIVAGEDFNAPFRFAEALLARARKLHALLKQLKAFFQGQISALEFAHNPLQFLERAFEVLWVVVHSQIVLSELPSLTVGLLTLTVTGWASVANHPTAA